MKHERPRALALVLLFIGVAFSIVEMRSPLYFSSRGDAQPYFLPLIRAHTDSWLDGEPLRMIWQAGSGWSPWESGQVGPLYPPYLLCNVIARCLGNSLLLLEVSAALHLSLAAGLVAWWLPRQFSLGARVACALLAALQPGAWVLGANWHPYLAMLPWFVLVALGLFETAQAPGWTQGAKAKVLAGSVFFFMTAHPQMYALGMCLLAIFRLSLDRDLWRGLADVAQLAVLQLPLAAGLFALYQRAMNATPDWMSARADRLFLVDGGLSWPAFAGGTLAGSWFDVGPYQEWGGITQPGNVVALFAPWVLVALWVSWKRKDPVFPLLLLAVMVVISAKSFSWVADFAVGPLAGFRWPWKLGVLLAPLALLSCLRSVSCSARAKQGAIASASLAVPIALAMIVEGRAVNFMPATEPGQPRGVLSTAEQTRKALVALGIRDGERIAIIGKASLLSASLPVPLIGLSGNGPLLYGIETAHLYEPLEARDVSETHGGLSTPWRVTVTLEEYLERPEQVEQAMAQLGVDWLVSRHSGAFLKRGAWTMAEDDLGRGTYARRLERAVPSFPFGSNGERTLALERRVDGSLVTGIPLSAPPAVKLARVMTWDQERDGRYRASVPRVPRGPLLGTLVCGLLAVALDSWLARLRAARTRSPAAAAVGSEAHPRP